MNYKKIIPLMIALLGFTVSCDKDDEEDNGGITPKYGVPASKYQEKSRVKTEQPTIILDEENPLDEQ